MAAVALMLALSANGAVEVVEEEPRDWDLEAAPPCNPEVYIEDEERDWELVRKINIRCAHAVRSSPAHNWHCAKKALGKALSQPGVGYTY